jgi:short-subunit dehydrogenase
MNLSNARVLITGAAGGIGACTARRLARAGAELLLTDLNADPLEQLADTLRADGTTVETLAVDVTSAYGRDQLASAAERMGVSVLINIAGINPFGLFEEQSERDIERAFAINTIAPLSLCRALLPVLAACDDAHIVNVGSTFGSLGYPGFAIYSASKYAVRGFTEALRRELADTSIRMHYVAPRATRTALSTDRVCAMNRELKVAMDPPESAAAAIESCLSRSRRETFLGGPERLFTLINSVLPGLVDRVIRRQLGVIRRHASQTPLAKEGREAPPTTLKALGAQR